jgi:hypothetical protein
MHYDAEIQRTVEQLGELIHHKLTTDPEIDALVKRIKHAGLMLTITVEANPDPVSPEELALTPFDRQLLKQMKIEAHEDTDAPDEPGS